MSQPRPDAGWGQSWCPTRRGDGGHPLALRADAQPAPRLTERGLRTQVVTNPSLGQVQGPYSGPLRRGASLRCCGWRARARARRRGPAWSSPGPCRPPAGSQARGIRGSKAPAACAGLASPSLRFQDAKGSTTFCFAKLRALGGNVKGRLSSILYHFIQERLLLAIKKSRMDKLRTKAIVFFFVCCMFIVFKI